MKKTLSIFILWLSLALPTSADGPIYLPVISQACGAEADMSDFKVVVPEANDQAFTNYVLNPSAEIAGSYTALGGATITRSTSFQHYGLYSYRLQAAANDMGISLLLEGLPFVNHYITIRVHTTTITAAWGWSLDDVNFTAPTLLEVIDSEWSLYGVSISAAQANGSNELYIRQSGTGALDLYLDGIQVEPKDGYYTTFCDGTQPGCEWTGAAHSSASLRSPDSRAGGRVLDLEDDYGFNVSGMSGTGTAPQELFIDSYSQLPGGELNSRKVNSRVITLNGFIDGTDEADLWAKKEAIQALFDPEAFPEDENGEQPVRLRFVGANVHKEISVFYEGGLETTITADDPACAREKVAVRFVADDPYWYEIGESAALLDTNDSATFRYVAARLRSTGQWSNLGPPSASGTYTDIYAIAEDATYVYIGGDFLNFDNIAAADYVVRYNKATGVYSALAALNGIVRAIVVAANGDVIVAGDFTNASGVAAADYIAVWAVGASAFTALGVPVSGAAAITGVHALAYDGSGNLYIGGDFDNWANVAAADNLVMWNGSAYVAVSTGANNTVRALAIGIDKTTLYLGGDFSAPGNFLAEWDGSSFTDIGTGIDLFVRALAVDPSGLLYVGGAFTTPGEKIVIWNGTTLVTMGSGIDAGSVTALAVGSDGSVWVGSGVVSTTHAGLSRWNGSVFTSPDVSLPGTPPTSPVIRAILASKYVDPVVPQKYNVWIGFNDTGTGTFAGLETVGNGGTAPAFPKVIFNRSGGTAATIQTLRNERTGKELLLNWSLQNGETLTVDLAPTKKSVVSSTGLPAQSAILANSDLGDWALSTGNNNITSFVSTSGSPTVVVYLLWKDAYKSQ